MTASEDRLVAASNRDQPRFSVRRRRLLCCLQETERGRDRLAPPQREGALKAGRVLKPLAEHSRDGRQLGMLLPDQSSGVRTYPISQGQFDQELGPDIPGMVDRPAEPGPGGPLAVLGRFGQGLCRAEAGMFLPDRADVAEQLQPVQGPVDDGLLDVPDLAQVSVPAQQSDYREPVSWLLADQAEHDPLGQRQPRFIAHLHGPHYQASTWTRAHARRPAPYCMPAEGLDWLPSPALLTDDEMSRLISVAVRRLGITEVRFAGGEPLIRRGLPAIISRPPRPSGSTAVQAGSGSPDPSPGR